MSQSKSPSDETRALSPPQPGDSDAPPRLRRPDRQQIIQPLTYDELVPHDHEVRAVWTLVQGWDLTLFLQEIRARGTRPGRAATDPQLLIALWLYAAIDGIACGRKLAKLCRESSPYRWLGAGITLNYHTLNDFRVNHEPALDDLLTQMIAALIEAQVISLERVAFDGTRIRASAGGQSFGEKETLQKHLEAARANWEAIQQSADDPTLSAQQKAARKRAARQRVERLEQALLELEKVEQAKAQQKEKPTKIHPGRTSATDPEARMMRMPDCHSRAIVGVEATNAGSDVGQDVPMRDQVETRADEAVQEQLVDGGFVSFEAIDRAAAEEVTFFAPVPEPRKAGVDRYLPKATDSAAVAQWRQRMGTRAAKRIYKQRSSTIETINGELKCQRGLVPILVRGLRKVQCAALWSALAYDVVHCSPILLSG
jgi:transposase